LSAFCFKGSAQGDKLFCKVGFHGDNGSRNGRDWASLLHWQLSHGQIGRPVQGCLSGDWLYAMRRMRPCVVVAISVLLGRVAELGSAGDATFL
jgi:hypothetical protein